MKIYLDLLPKKRKLEIKRKKRFLSILRQELLFLFPVAVFIAILFNIWYLVSVKRDSLLIAQSTAQSQDKYKELSAYEKKFKEVNEASALLLKIKDGHLYWHDVFEKLSKLDSEGVMINDLSTKNYRVYLLGRARDRETLLNFKDKLGSEDCFEQVNLPLSNLVVKTDVDFQVDFSIKKDCLKRK
ncbi:MAG: hypothetical protein ACD_8C00066G0003 [uncultured bacterium]|nr:MAG: hypothetical protein ACD_8C00066G0003 [uncultured bacterium]